MSLSVLVNLLPKVRGTEMEDRGKTGFWEVR